MNYFGSKSRISSYIVPIIQKYIDDNNVELYIEPFCGGLNVIDKIRCHTKIAADINKYLIALFKHVKAGGSLPDIVKKETYDKARAAWYNDNTDSRFEDWEIGCYGWLCSYSGRGFDGGWSYEGLEKKTNGTVVTRNYYQERKRNLLKQFEQPLCQDITFRQGDYRGIVGGSEQAVIYCDPPYNGTKQFANAKRFDYEEFWNIMREWSKNNIVIISELEAPADFECIWSHEVCRSIKATDKSRAVEKLFIWKGNK